MLYISRSWHQNRLGANAQFLCRAICTQKTKGPKIRRLYEHRTLSEHCQRMHWHVTSDQTGAGSNATVWTNLWWKQVREYFHNEEISITSFFRLKKDRLPSSGTTLPFAFAPPSLSRLTTLESQFDDCSMKDYTTKVDARGCADCGASLAGWACRYPRKLNGGFVWTPTVIVLRRLRNVGRGGLPLLAAQLA